MWKGEEEEERRRDKGGGIPKKEGSVTSKKMDPNDNKGRRRHISRSESESESEEEDDAFGPSTARKDNVNWTDVTDVARESVIFLCFMIMYLKRFWHRVK